MDAIISWLNDRKNMPIVIAIAAILLVLFFVLMKVTGRIGGSAEKEEGTTVAQGGAGSTTGTQGSVPGAMPGMMPGAPMMPGMMPGMMGGTSQQATVAAAPAVKQPPMLPYRKDPFEPLGGQPSKIDRLASMIPSVPRVRLQPVTVELPDSALAEALPPQPNRRVAGIMWNGKVSALLETNGEIDIVKPGSVINKGNSKVVVEKIMPDSVILKTLDTKKPHTIRVGLAGSPSAAAASPITSMPGMPTMPGMMPGAPMMPGMMPGAISPTMPGMVSPTLMPGVSNIRQ